MRLLLILVVGLFYASTLYAAENTRENTREKTQPWNAGVWDEKRMENFESYELFFIGEKFLTGRTGSNGLRVQPDPITAEILFEGATRKNPEETILITFTYLNDAQNFYMALKWATRGLKLGVPDAKKTLGLVLFVVGRELETLDYKLDFPNFNALSWMYGAAELGSEEAAIIIDPFVLLLNPKKLEKIKAAAKKILQDPAESYKSTFDVIKYPDDRVAK